MVKAKPIATPFGAKTQQHTISAGQIGPDAKLIALCASFHTIHSTVPDPDKAKRHNPLWLCAEEVTKRRAKTWQGIVAKAATALALIDLDGDCAHDVETRYAANVLRDIAQVSSAEASQTIATRETTDPDAKLHTLRAEAADIQRQYLVDMPDEESDALADRKWENARQIAELPAITSEGLRSKAAVLLHLFEGAYCDRDLTFYEGQSEHDRIAITILRDIVRGPAPMPGPSGADAALIADCAAFDVLEHIFRDAMPKMPAGTAFETICQAEQDVDAKRDHVVKLQEPLVNRIYEATATTLAGHVARARSLGLWDAELLKGGNGDTGDTFVHALVRDMIGAEADEPAPDAELIKLDVRLTEQATIEAEKWDAAEVEPGDDGPLTVAAKEETEITSAIVKQIAAIPATSLAGVLAKARAMMWCRNGEPMDDDTETTEGITKASLFRDLSSMAAPLPLSVARRGAA